MTTSGQGALSIQPSRAKRVLSQVIACLALDLLLIDLGMSVNFVTMVMPRVLNAKEGLSINEYQATWFGSMAFLCQPLGSVFSGPLLDTLGRKKSLFVVSVPHIVAWILMYSAWDVTTLFLANALLGFGTGLMEAPSVTYVGEVSESSVRGILTTLTNGFTATGMFVAYLLGAVLPWRHAALACLLVPIASMMLVLLVPETPIWLLSKGRQKDALKSLCRLRGWAKPEDVKTEFDNLIQYNDILQQCVICLKTEKTGYPCNHKNALFFKRTLLKIKHVLLAKETLRPFTLVMAYFFFHTMSGLAPIRPNMVNVCNALGMKNVHIVVPMIGAVFIAMSLLSALIVKLIGKRKLIISSMLATACCSLSLSVYARMNVDPGVFSYEMETFPIEKTVLPVVLFMLLACFTALGIPWILLSEVFPFRSRGIATSLAAASNYAVFFVAAKTNFNIEAYFQLSGSFAIYSTFGFIGAIYLYFFLPETENKSLVEIEKYYQGESRIFADDFLINAFRKKRSTSLEANKPMLVK